MAYKIVERRRFVWSIENITQENVGELKEMKNIYSDMFKVVVDGSETKWWQDNGNCGFYILNDDLECSNLSLMVDVAARSSDNQIHYLKSISTDVYEMGENVGRSKFLNVNDYLDETNDTLTFIIDLKLSKGVPPIAKTPNAITNLVGNLFNSETFSDVAIVCSDEKKLPAHRNILYGRSSVFKAMLDAEMTEKKSARVVVSDIDSETMLEVLRFIYTEEIQNVDALATKLIYAAEKYDLKELKAMCVSELVNQISSQNVLQYLLLADRYNEEILFEECMEVIHTNFQKLKTSQHWKNVNADLMFKCMQYLEESAAAIIPLKSSFAD